MSAVPKDERVPAEVVAEAYDRHNGSIRATAAELGISRSSVSRILKPLGRIEKPIAAGSIHGTEFFKKDLPAEGEVKRYIITSAQNNTYVHKGVWDNLQAMAKHYNAEVMVGTFTYNQNHFGHLSVKRHKAKGYQYQMWYDPTVVPFIDDRRVQLGEGLVWCGEYNALPTNHNPLASLESYTGRKSAIFPHVKLAMRSVATMQGEGVKLNFTTGTVTLRNYIQKREGNIAEFHHVYGGLLVEVDSKGHWWVRQLNHDEGTGTMQDLNVLVKNGEVICERADVEAVTHGDLHGTMADQEAVAVSQDLVDTLHPRYQFVHDVLEGAAINPHVRKYDAIHDHFNAWMRGYHRFENELVDTARLLESFHRDWCDTIIVDSNHDDPWIKRWLRNPNNIKDPSNVELFLKLEAHLYKEIRNGQTNEQAHARTAKPKLVRDTNMLEYAMREIGGYKSPAQFLIADQSFLIADRKIEAGMHGHLGPNGTFASPENLSKMGRKANTAHTHCTGIWNGLYVAGTLSKLRWDYAKGPSGWTHSDIVTYPNGKRTIVTFYNGKWRA